MIERRFYSMRELAPVIEQTVADGRRVKFTVTGNSMFPLFADRRDQVTVEKAADIRKYDIVLHLRDDGHYILHRVISVKNGVLTIAGDNETCKEHNVSPNQVIARVTSFDRKGRECSLNSFWYKLYCRVWLMIFPARHMVLRILLSVRRLLRGKK
ncbi:MAG: S24 family peptidase [Clostridia bacterium]|nr:S24 family peptidase [Clostridia bacterium]